MVQLMPRCFALGSTWPTRRRGRGDRTRSAPFVVLGLPQRPRRPGGWLLRLARRGPARRGDRFRLRPHPHDPPASQDTPADDDHAVPPIPLDFLTPSEQPGILGTLDRYQVLAVLGRAHLESCSALDPDSCVRSRSGPGPLPGPERNGPAAIPPRGRAAANISHDHVVKIHSIEPAALPYLVMEYVSGVSPRVD